MYLAAYGDAQLGGFGSKLKKAVKKVVKPALHITAAVLTGGATIPVSAQKLLQDKAKKAAQAQAAAEAAEFDRQAAAIKQMQTAPAPTATPAAPVVPVTTIAPTQAAVQQQVSQAQLQPVTFTVPSDRPTAKRVKTARPTADMPKWVIPVGLGAAALAAVMALKGKR